ncbi:MAG: hypothetical protein P4M00_20140 [Azospirillaceae bacterium]|nr:hypothetical protein [Azospirillaceae bacterium]
MSIWSARLLAVITLVLIACFTYLACLRASKSAPLSAALGVGWLLVTEPQLALMSVSYHWLTTLFAMAAAWATLASIDQPGRRVTGPLIAGLGAGMATMVIETVGALTMLAGIAAFINIRRYRTEIVAYIAGSLTIPGAMLLYVIANHAFYAAFDDVILFAFQQYSSIQYVPFGIWSNDATRALKYVFPFVGFLTLFVGVLNGRSGLRDRMLWSCVAFGVAGFAGSFPRPDVYHIAETAPLVCPLLAYGAARILRTLRPRYRILVAGAVILFIAPAVRAYTVQSLAALRAPLMPTPRGDAAFLWQSQTATLLARIAATPPGDRYFFYPYMPMMPFLAARDQISQIDIFTPMFTTPSQYRDACIAVMQQASWVIIDRKWTDQAWLHIVFPAMRDTGPPETLRFEQALETGFERVTTDDTFEMRRRRDGADASLCDGIAP